MRQIRCGTSALLGRLRQPQFAVLRNHDLMPLPSNKIKNAQKLVYLRIGIAAHAAVIHYHKELASMLIAAQLLGYVDEMPAAAVEGAHDMKFAIVPFVSPVGIESQIYVGIFGKVKLFDVAVPMPDADEKLFDVISGRVHAEVPVVYIELQDAVVQKRPHLRSHIHAPVAVAIFRRH